MKVYHAFLSLWLFAVCNKAIILSPVRPCYVFSRLFSAEKQKCMMVLVVLNWSSWSDHLTSVQNPKPAQPDQNETVFPTGLTHQTHMAYMLSDLRGNLSMTRILNAQIMILYIGSSFSEGIILTVKVTVLGRNSQLANKILRALEYFPTFS